MSANGLAESIDSLDKLNEINEKDESSLKTNEMILDYEGDTNKKVLVGLKHLSEINK